jgi:hypothetical protein
VAHWPIEYLAPLFNELSYRNPLLSHILEGFQVRRPKGPDKHRQRDDGRRRCEEDVGLLVEKGADLESKCKFIRRSSVPASALSLAESLSKCWSRAVISFGRERRVSFYASDCSMLFSIMRALSPDTVPNWLRPVVGSDGVIVS